MLNSLVNQLETTATEMKNSLKSTPNRPSFSPLFQLQHYCETRIGLTQDKMEIFICFYFSNVIGYIFYNLAGDTPYSLELHHARASLASTITEELERVVKSLRGADDKELLLGLASLVSESVARVVNLNKAHCM